MSSITDKRVTEWLAYVCLFYERRVSDDTGSVKPPAHPYYVGRYVL